MKCCSKRAPVRNRNRGGRLVQKRIDPQYEFPEFGKDETPYIVLRTGEMYLNGAEAAFETGNTAQAKAMINNLEAGRMPAKTTITLDLIKNERFVELFAENHRCWDLRTWKDAVKELHMTPKFGSKWTRRASDGKYKASKWKWNFSQIHFRKMYWFPIGTNRMAQNPNLVASDTKFKIWLLFIKRAQFFEPFFIFIYMKKIFFLLFIILLNSCIYNDKVMFHPM